MVLLVVVVQTLHAAALPGLLGEPLVGPLGVVAATRASSSSSSLLAALRTVRVAPLLAAVLGLAVAPGLLQTVGGRQVGHGQHALDGFLGAGRRRRLTAM